MPKATNAKDISSLSSMLEVSIDQGGQIVIDL